MFEDSLVESAGRLKTKRGITTVFSFGVQFVIIGVLILLPLIYTEALPRASLTTFLVAPPPPPPPPPPPAAVVIKHVQSNIVEGALRTPTKIPNKVVKIVEDDSPAPAPGVMGGVMGGVPGGSSGGVLGGILSAANTPPPKVAPQKIRVSSGVATGLLINKVTPQYPPIARAARISGSVQLQATISKSGAIENLKVISGHPMLIQAALDAVRQWRYKPYMLNGEPVEVETQVTVNFNMSGG